MNIVSSTILLNTIKKLSPRYLAGSPMLAIVAVISCIATALLFREIYLPDGQISLYLQIVFWLWMTVLFSTFADSYAESKMEYCDVSPKVNRAITVKRLVNQDDLTSFEKVAKDNIKSGNLILLEVGDTVPFDGVIVKGSCYVSESETTGLLETKPKDPVKNNILTAGSIIESGEQTILKVSFSIKYSFYTKAQRLLKAITRQSLPSELVLQRLILGISVLFMAVIFSIWVIARYSQFSIPLIYLLDLIVVLLPTTISGLQHAIITFGKAKLQKQGILVQDPTVIDSVVDVNVILLDKTGTITIGKREMTAFENVSELNNEAFMEVLFLSSLADSTHEGKSIKAYAIRHSDYKARDIDEEHYEYLPFSPSEPISGCNYQGDEIRKGSVNAVAHYLGKTVSMLPEEILSLTKQVAIAQGTPLLLTLNKKIVGVIHLRDRFRRGTIKQIQKLHEQGMHTVLITGDNALTAAYVAKKVGIRESYANATPEKKLELVRNLQQQGYVVAMCGDGINDSLALAQADIGITFEGGINGSSIMTGNIISQYHDLYAFVELKNICKKMTVKRGSLTVFSLASDVAKYFVIVPALFTTAFPPLAVLNFMQFHSLESVILASIMFNALVILAMIPLLFKGFNKTKSRYSLWTGILLYGIGGVVSPFVFIKLLEIFIYTIGLL
ncbi:MAG: potassium-transporting ATPase subunit KdpB [Rickettsiaceae bacterium]